MRNPLRRFPVLLAALLAAPPAMAMVALEEHEMAGVQGQGLAFAFDDFSFRMAPTSFIEATGTQPTAQAAAAGWKRGDLRYFGLSITSGGAAGTDWFGNGCGSSTDPLRCPLGTGGVPTFASVFNPFILRVFQNEGFDFQGVFRDNPVAGQPNTMPTVLELIGPSDMDPWRWSFWGEIEVDRGAGGGGLPTGLLQSQTIIHGKPVATGRIWQGGNNYVEGTARPAILRLMQTANTADTTLGFTYQSAIQGDFRFSVRQNLRSGQSDNQSGVADNLHIVPDFNDDEGLHLRNVDAFIPLGFLHAQALTFSGASEFDASGNKLASPVQNGNFSIELTQIPNNANVYNNFYCGSTNGSCALAADGSIANPNQDTQGYVRWGNWANPLGPTGNGVNDLPTATSTANGIYFSGGASGTQVTNLGIGRIEGMRIHHMRITTLGAGI